MSSVVPGAKSIHLAMRGLLLLLWRVLTLSSFSLPGSTALRHCTITLGSHRCTGRLSDWILFKSNIRKEIALFAFSPTVRTMCYEDSIKSLSRCHFVKTRTAKKGQDSREGTQPKWSVFDPTRDWFVTDQLQTLSHSACLCDGAVIASYCSCTHPPGSWQRSECRLVSL